MSKSTERPVLRVIEALRGLEGEGFDIRRAIPAAGLEAVGPFIFLDHMGPMNFGPGEAKGAPNHPHRGFETLTYLLEGRGEHHDSLGNHSVIGPGEAQWMRAGSGVLHDEGADETLRREGGRLHGLQFWINLPKGRKMSPPAYRHVAASDIPELRRDGAVIRLIAGSLDGARGPVETFADPFLAHIALAPGAIATLAPHGEAGVYVAAGEVRVGAQGMALGEGGLALLGPGEAVTLAADGDAQVFVLGGAPLDAPVRRYGPFVMNTAEELQEAVRDFQAGRFGTIPTIAATLRARSLDREKIPS